MGVDLVGVDLEGRYIYISNLREVDTSQLRTTDTDQSPTYLSQYKMVPVRYRPNAASGGWSYGRDLCHCREKGNTRFETVMYFDLDC